MNAPARTVRLAAVQMASRNGDVEGNLARATPLVEQAAAQGARLVLLPELMPSGYLMTPAMWDAAEPKHGATARWLAETARRLAIFVGTSFLEAQGEDFFNTFVLVRPDGEEAIRVRKQRAAATEAYFFKGAEGPHAVDTELGRIGVGICYENVLAWLPRLLQRESVDLVLMPHSAPTLTEAPLLVSRKDVVWFEDMLRESAPRLARQLGVPAVMANKCGPFRSPLPKPLPPADAYFPGLSAIADGDGTVKAQLAGEEGVIVADVTLDPARKTTTPPPCHGQWAIAPPWFAGLLTAVEVLGRACYRLSRQRRRRAQEISA